MFLNLHNGSAMGANKFEKFQIKKNPSKSVFESGLKENNNVCGILS